MGSSVMRSTRARKTSRMGRFDWRASRTVTSKLGELHFAEGHQDVFFAGEVVEEGAFADIGGFGDVFDGGFGRSPFLRKG